MPKPSVGRIVLVTVHPRDNNGAEAAPAVITRVWNDHLVNLRVLSDGPSTSWLTSVHLYDSRDELDEAATGAWYTAAYWPPLTDGPVRRLQPGAIVQYRGRQGLQALRGALVTATADTLDPRGVDAGQVAPLTSPEHVHLFVLTPSNAVGFPEYDVPRDADPGMCRPGTWQWPTER
jgi:hypothetical protein